ncbi:MAG: S9 family peptidase [Bacteroidales bacterium]|nr:S9 family peptidase [Bacteroidales bacterium]
MKKSSRIQVFSLVIIMSLMVSNAFGQFRGRSSSVRWADDTHYYQTQKDKKGNDVLMKVDAVTGKTSKTKKQAQTQRRIENVTIGVKKGNIYLLNRADDSERQLTANPGLERNPRFSGDKKRIAFTRNHDLFVLDLESGLEHRLTMDGDSLVYNGYASWVYFEEILGRGSRYAAFWWSPDGKKLAFLRFDDSPVPLFTLMRADSLHGAPEFTRYPKPGDPNPIVKLGIADIESGKVVWADFDETVDQYIAWPFWEPNSSEMLIQVLNRDQNDMQFFMVDPANGNVNRIYQEKRKTWVEFFEDLYVMNNGSGYIIRSAKSDWMNLYYYDWNGNLKAQLTNLNFRVNSINKVDEENGKVYFTATGKESTESHFFSVNLDGTQLVQLTEGAGVHRTVLSPGGSYLIDTWSNVKLPSRKEVRDSKGKLVRVIEEKEYSYDPTKNPRTEMLKIPSTDGFVLPAKITYPLNFDENKKYPVVFTVYGGPDAGGGLKNSYSDGYASWYAKNNIITIDVAHRASGHFGKKGLDYIWRNLGKWEVIDYSAAVKWLRKQPYVDASKMGITGGSYGGYMTCMALTSGADFWTHGVANSELFMAKWMITYTCRTHYSLLADCRISEKISSLCYTPMAAMDGAEQKLFTVVMNSTSFG